MKSSKTKQEIALIIGMSLRTFQRKLKAANLKIPRGLVSPEDQDKIYLSLGYLHLASENKKRQMTA